MATSGPAIVTLPPTPWRHRAACRNLDPDLFTPVDGEGEEVQHLQDAARFCHQSECPVIDECRDYALVTRQSTGVWGGLLATERDEILATRRRSD